MPRNILTIILFIVPLSASAQSEPASTPTSSPSREVEELITRTCLSVEGDTEARVRLDACRRYLAYFPKGVWLEEVQQRINTLNKTATSGPVLDESAELDLTDFAHPRKKGDIPFLVGLGLNSPSGSFGVQSGYSIVPRVQVLGAVGVDDRKFRGGVLGRFYLRDSRLSPSAMVGFSFSPARNSTGEGTNEDSKKTEIVSLRLGPSAVAHLGLGFGFRFISGFTLAADAGYAQPLFEQVITPFETSAPPLDNPDKVRDGGGFLSIIVGYTF
jgi:hypothetical protein